MKIIAINGSPRKNSNTAILLNNALQGAASQGAETEIINLYDLNYKGCKSCFACKLKDGKSLLDKKIPVGFIYSMNVTEEFMKEAGYLHALKFIEDDLKRVFGSCDILTVNDTFQFNDYSKYVMEVFDADKKKKVRDEHFPIDCKNAFNLGVSLINKIEK